MEKCIFKIIKLNSYFYNTEIWFKNQRQLNWPPFMFYWQTSNVYINNKWNINNF